MSTPPASNPTFNASDFITSTGFTEAQATALFPRMATESTCSAKQNFVGGIEVSDLASSVVLNLGSDSSIVNLKGDFQLGGSAGLATQVLTSNGSGNAPTWTSSAIDGSTPTQPVQILPLQTSGAVYLAPGLTGSTLIKLGNGVSPVRASSILLSGSFIDNASSPSGAGLSFCGNCATGTVSIAAAQTGGVLNIGTDVSARSGAINIGTGALSTHLTNIHSGSTAQGTLSLATGLSSATIVRIADGATSTGSLLVGAAGRTLTLRGDASSTIDIAAGTLTCGATSVQALAAASVSTTGEVSALSLKADLIDSKNASATLIIGDTCTDILFAKPINNANFKAGIDGGGTTLTIGTGSTTSNLVLGQSSKLSYLYGTAASNIDISTTGTIKCGSINAVGTKLYVGCGTGSTCTSLDIGRVAAGYTTAIIGNATCSGTLGVTGLSTLAGVNSGAHSASSLIVSGTGTTQLGTGTFTLGAPITLSSTLPTLGVIGTPNSTQLGGFTLGTAYPAIMGVGANILTTITIVTAGVYLVNLDLSGGVAAIPTNYFITLSGTATGFPTSINWGMSSVNGANISFDISRMMRVIAGTLVFTLNLAGNGMTSTAGSALATRIA